MTGIEIYGAGHIAALPAEERKLYCILMLAYDWGNKFLLRSALYVRTVVSMYSMTI